MEGKIGSNWKIIMKQKMLTQANKKNNHIFIIIVDRIGITKNYQGHTTKTKFKTLSLLTDIGSRISLQNQRNQRVSSRYRSQWEQCILFQCNAFRDRSSKSYRQVDSNRQ
jgi:hypothetical protein